MIYSVLINKEKITIVTEITIFCYKIWMLFYKFLGGSEKFQDKKTYFYKEVCQLCKSTREEKAIEVRRSNLLEDVGINISIE